MAGVVLEFGLGYLGIERCLNPNDNKEFLMAHIYSASTGRRSSSPVDIIAVESFLFDAMKQCALLRGFTEEQLANIGLEKIVDEVLESRKKASDRHG